MKLLFREMSAWFWTFILNMPGSLGVKFREFMLLRQCPQSSAPLRLSAGSHLEGLSNITFGGDNAIGRGCQFYATEGKIFLGAGSSLNAGVFLGADFGEIRIGTDVIVGPGVVIRAANHRFDASPRIPIRKQGHEGALIEIGDDVWLGANVSILPGAKIGDHCIIGAGAVVTGNIPRCSVAVGVPAKVIKSLS